MDPARTCRRHTTCRHCVRCQQPEEGSRVSSDESALPNTRTNSPQTNPRLTQCSKRAPRAPTPLIHSHPPAFTPIHVSHANIQTVNTAPHSLAPHLSPDPIT